MSTNETTSSDGGPLMSHSIKFAILITLEFPSIFISMLIFGYFGYYHRTKITDYNHSILLLLAINFLQVLVDLPMPINYFRLNGLVRPATAAYCVWWIWFEFSLNTTNGLLMAWISFERHILIFHRHTIRTKGTWKRFSLHIFPLIFCSVWGGLFYIVAVVFSPMCTSEWSFDALLCTIPCYLTTNWGTFDLFVNVISPTCLIFLMNLTLFIRIIYQQMLVVGRTQQNRSRQQRMAFQLGLISLLYLAVWMPLSIAQLGQIYIGPTFLFEQLDTFNYLVYIVPLLLPFFCLMSMPELIAFVKSVLCRRNERIHPFQSTTQQPNQTNQTNQTNQHSTARVESKY